MIDINAIQYVSNCCGAAPRSYNNDCDSLDIGICPECHDHCEFVAYDENGNEISAADIEAAKARDKFVEQEIESHKAEFIAEMQARNETQEEE